MVIVIYKLPRQWIIADKKQVVAAEFLIVDEECLPVVLTLWESFAAIQAIELDYELRQGNFPVVHVQNVHCSLYQGTRYASAFDMAPTIERAVELNQWKAANVDVIRNMITNKAHLQSLIRLAKPLSRLLYKEADLTVLHDTSAIIWLKGNIVIPPGNRLWRLCWLWILLRKDKRRRGIKHDCMHCGGKNAMRYRVGVNVTDETGYANAIMFCDEVDKLLSLCGVRIENGSVNIDILAQKLAQKTFIVGLKRNTNDELRRGQCEYVMSCLEDATNLQLQLECTPEKETQTLATTSNASVTVGAESSTKRKLNFGVNIATKQGETVPCLKDASQLHIKIERTPEKETQVSAQATGSPLTVNVESASTKRKLNFDVPTPTKEAEPVPSTAISQAEPPADNAKASSHKKQIKAWLKH